jgi:hypothetical protein
VLHAPLPPLLTLVLLELKERVLVQGGVLGLRRGRRVQVRGLKYIAVIFNNLLGVLKELVNACFDLVILGYYVFFPWHHLAKCLLLLVFAHVDRHAQLLELAEPLMTLDIDPALQEGHCLLI